MTRYYETAGSGPELVLLHGWGLHAGVWEPIWSALTERFRVTRVDLPGHGHNADTGLGTLDEVVAHVLSAVPRPAAWLGWSLGGLVALQAAQTRPAMIRQVLLVASNPCMVQRADWPEAIEAAVLDTFAHALAEDYQATLQRFLALQCRGIEQPGATLRQLRQLMAAAPPHPQALRDGLDILRYTDLRQVTKTLKQPLAILLGAKDTLVPARLASSLREWYPQATVECLDHAGHAPFLTQPQAVTAWVMAQLAGADDAPNANE